MWWIAHIFLLNSSYPLGCWRWGLEIKVFVEATLKLNLFLSTATLIATQNSQKKKCWMPSTLCGLDMLQIKLKFELIIHFASNCFSEIKMEVSLSCFYVMNSYNACESLFRKLVTRCPIFLCLRQCATIHRMMIFKHPQITLEWRIRGIPRGNICCKLFRFKFSCISKREI